MATLACVMSAAVCAQSVKPAIPRDENLEARIEKTPQGMTLDEKVGQMLEINIDVVGSYKPDKKGNNVFQLDMNKLDTIIGKYKVGSFLNCPGKGLTVAEWQKVIPTIQKLSMKYMKIPTIYGLDNNHGSTYVLGGTLFPQPINLGASFNVDLAREMAITTAYESRANSTVHGCTIPRSTWAVILAGPVSGKALVRMLWSTARWSSRRYSAIRAATTTT